MRRSSSPRRGYVPSAAVGDSRRGVDARDRRRDNDDDGYVDGRGASSARHEDRGRGYGQEYKHEYSASLNGRIDRQHRRSPSPSRGRSRSPPRSDARRRRSRSESRSRSPPSRRRRADSHDRRSDYREGGARANASPPRRPRDDSSNVTQQRRSDVSAPASPPLRTAPQGGASDRGTGALASNSSAAVAARVVAAHIGGATAVAAAPAGGFNNRGAGADRGGEAAAGFRASGANTAPLGAAGPADSRRAADDSAAAPRPAPPAVKPDFGLSGALAADHNTGNVYNGVTLKWAEPADASKPPASVRWQLHVFKSGEPVGSPIYIGKVSATCFGRDRRIADIVTDHPSTSSQHAVLQFRAVSVPLPRLS